MGASNPFAEVPDVFFCVVFEGKRIDLVEPGWQPGPLALSVVRLEHDAAFSGTEDSTDRRARSMHFAPRVEHTLYDPKQMGELPLGVGRWNLDLAKEPREGPAGLALVAWEYFSPIELGEDRQAWFVAHLQLADDADPEAVAFDIGSPLGVASQWLRSQLATANVSTRPSLLSHMLWRSDTVPRLPSLPATLEWPAEAQWAWVLGTGIPPASFIPRGSDPIPGTEVSLSADWRARVFRHGVALIATSGSSATNHQLLRTFARSLYLDAFLLSRVQIRALRDFADELSQGRLEEITASQARALQGRFLELRRAILWSDVSQRGRNVEHLIHASHVEWELQSLYDKVREDLTDLATYVQTLEADHRQQEDASRRAALEHADQRAALTNLFLAILSTILLPLTVVFTIAQVAADPSPTVVLIAGLISIALMAALWIGFPGLRPSRDELNRLRRTTD